MIECDRCGMPVMVHEEDSSIIDANVAKGMFYWTKRFNLCPACTDVLINDYFAGKAIPALEEGVTDG